MIPNLLIVGLGNPGARYNHTRHNLGATWIRNLCQLHAAKLQENLQLNAYITYIEEFKTICMISNNYMNNSGLSVKAATKLYSLSPENILVIHDDLDLPIGKIKFKLNGGHGGHNGLCSIIQKLNSQQFKRLRIGIGRPIIKELITEYVLSKASAEEQIPINQAIRNSLKLLPEIASLNWSQVMQLLNNHQQDLGEM